VTSHVENKNISQVTAENSFDSLDVSSIFAKSNVNESSSETPPAECIPNLEGISSKKHQEDDPSVDYYCQCEERQRVLSLEPSNVSIPLGCCGSENLSVKYAALCSGPPDSTPSERKRLETKSIPKGDQQQHNSGEVSIENFNSDVTVTSQGEVLCSEINVTPFEENYGSDEVSIRWPDAIRNVNKKRRNSDKIHIIGEEIKIDRDMTVFNSQQCIESITELVDKKVITMVDDYRNKGVKTRQNQINRFKIVADEPFSMARSTLNRLSTTLRLLHHDDVIGTVVRSSEENVVYDKVLYRTLIVQ